MLLVGFDAVNSTFERPDQINNVTGARSCLEVTWPDADANADGVVIALEIPEELDYVLFSMPSYRRIIQYRFEIEVADEFISRFYDQCAIARQTG